MPTLLLLLQPILLCVTVVPSARMIRGRLTPRTEVLRP
jgi:hypothetical protein